MRNRVYTKEELMAIAVTNALFSKSSMDKADMQRAIVKELNKFKKL